MSGEAFTSSRSRGGGAPEGRGNAGMDGTGAGERLALLGLHNLW